MAIEAGPDHARYLEPSAQLKEYHRFSEDFNECCYIPVAVRAVLSVSCAPYSGCENVFGKKLSNLVWRAKLNGEGRLLH